MEGKLKEIASQVNVMTLEQIALAFVVISMVFFFVGAGAGLFIGMLV